MAGGWGRERGFVGSLYSYIRELKHQMFLIHEWHGWLHRTGLGMFSVKQAFVGRQERQIL